MAIRLSRFETGWKIYFRLLLLVFPLQTVAFESTLLDEHPLSSLLNQRVQASQFAPGMVTYLPGELIVERMRPILRERLASTNYDRMQGTLQFLDHYEEEKIKDSTLSPLLSLKNFNYDLCLKDGRGASCVGLAFDMFRHLPPDISGYINAARLPKKYQQFAAPDYCHVSVLVAFQHPENLSDRGFVLLDPSFDFHEPILLKTKGPPYAYHMGKKGIWNFSIQEDVIICQVCFQKNNIPTAEEYENLRMIYRTDRLLNPVESSAIPMMLIDRRLSCLSRRADGKHISHLNIELNKNRIVWDQEGEMRAPVPFNAIEEKEWEFNETFANGLFIDKDELNRRVQRIVQEREVLNQLYLEYLHYSER